MATINRLSDKAIRNVKKPGFYNDGGGLYLQVRAGTDGPARSWIFRYEVEGRQRYLGLGSLDTIGLATAREKARAARELRLERKDPIAEKRAQRSAAAAERARSMTFDEARDAYVTAHRAAWRSAKVARQWTQSLEDHVSPLLGKVLVKDIDAGLVLKAIEPLWNPGNGVKAKAVTAGRLRERIENILDWATARGARTGENPARWDGNLEYQLPKLAKVHKVAHMPALPYRDAGAFMASLRERGDVGAPALEFLILTATRSNEVIGARWSEIVKDDDTGLDIWTIPAERTKAHREHRVPLSPAALELLARMPRDGEFIFRGRNGGKLGHNAMLQTLAAMGRTDITAHGFRSTFRDWAAERTNFQNHIAEMALAHAIDSAVEKSYRRGDLLRKRAELMAAWAGYCARLDAKGGEVVPIRATL
jgi:integrase